MGFLNRLNSLTHSSCLSCSLDYESKKKIMRDFSLFYCCLVALFSLNSCFLINEFGKIFCLNDERINGKKYNREQNACLWKSIFMIHSSGSHYHHLSTSWMVILGGRFRVWVSFVELIGF